MGSFGFGSKDISEWKSTGIYNYSSRSNMNALANSKNDLPNLKNDGRMHVSLSGNHFQQNKVIIPNNNNAINIYCVYKLNPIASRRDTSFTIQNALFGAMQILKMWLIGLTVSLFSIIKTKALECVSVVNQKCMPRPKILHVNEGVGEALFYLYNVLVNKCSGSCNTFSNPMAKLCVPNVIKRVNMQVYNFLMMLNETRNVLWHESCKCVCKSNSSICNNKQIWNGDTCRCDCNEDFAGIINCTKGYMWNPSTCTCECDMWCKPGQYLDH